MTPRLLLAAALSLSVAAPAAADWLVTRSGDEIETVGAWEVRGALVVFQAPGGHLRSLRVSEVDLEASRERTDAPPEVEPEPEEPAPTGPVRVITDADVERAARPAEESSEPAAADPDPSEGEDAGSTEEAAASTLEVLDWRDRVDVQANLLEITGTVVNRGSSVVTDPGIVVQLLGSTGGVIESASAGLAQPYLGPGERTTFTATFAGNPGYTSVEFDIRARGFRIGPPTGTSVDP